ncbi:hypothetical protein HZA97_01975 [Candidatus Woesearchaeota archaeon]|nr:hypothetical protein [Candidatus Woesearchaeota archaeon]
MSESNLEKVRRTLHGQMLEVILFEGAEFKNWQYTSTTPFLDKYMNASKDDDLRYMAGERMTDKPGVKIIGYVVDVTETYLVMRTGWGKNNPCEDMPGWRIDHDCIYFSSLCLKREASNS